VHPSLFNDARGGELGSVLYLEGKSYEIVFHVVIVLRCGIMRDNGRLGLVNIWCGGHAYRRS